MLSERLVIVLEMCLQGDSNGRKKNERQFVREEWRGGERSCGNLRWRNQQTERKIDADWGENGREG